MPRPDIPPALRPAYAACERLARAHYENFPVASRLLPGRLRPHVAAIYAFARTADDYADEPGPTVDQRLALLADWGDRLHGRRGPSARPLAQVPAATNADPDAIFEALAHTIDRFDLPRDLFDDLLSAFSQDVTTARYQTWADVMDYCRRSANPVGRLVLRLSGYRDPHLDAASDAVCTALQLTNFWQDLAIDWSRGRLYVPTEIRESAGAPLAALDAREWPPEWQHALADCGTRTRTLFEQGRRVCDGVSGRLRHELRATWLGGRRILDRLEQAGFDSARHRPSLSLADAVVIACRTLVWNRSS